ncbi:MAG: putative 2,3-bisphosphoglycerate-independent phosphoglycerate mutase [Nitrospirales bacterium]|nr:MAG: putative 2,3-bisphosphoglycerate-independent phosphoglycerate mutase [Nitrospirales bacterium]
MKTVIVQGDGLASRALPELDGQTLLQVANTPNLDEVATQGELGTLTLPSSQGISLSSAVVHLSLLGYDPAKYYSGLGPFEAASLEIVLEQHDMAFLCQFVTLGASNGRGDDKKLGPSLILHDEEAGGIDTEDARELIDVANEQLGSEAIQFYTGERHRHVMVWIGCPGRCRCYNPRIARGRTIEPFLPSGKGADVLKELMEASRILLRRHPVNLDREQEKRSPANCLWLWGPGKAIELPKWNERWSISNMTLSPSSVHRGVALCAGMNVLNHLDYGGNQSEVFRQYVHRCLTEIQTKDFVYVHVPMTEIENTQTIHETITMIEMFDEQVIEPLLRSLSERGDCRLVIVGSHAAEDAQDPLRSPTPYAVFSTSQTRHAEARSSFDEPHAVKGPARDATRMLVRMLAAEAS